MVKSRNDRKFYNRRIYLVVSALAFLCIILSIVIYLQKSTDNQVIDNVCSALGSTSQCDTVQQSKYGRIFGIDNAVYGIIGFTALMMLSWAFYRTGDILMRKLVFLGAFIAGIMALWFLYIQAFVIGAYCVFCVAVDIISIVLMITAAYLFVWNRYFSKRKF